MLLDLGRNDVGRVARGSGPVRSPTSSSSSATVMSCTSSPTSRARSRPDRDALDASRRRISGRHGVRRAQGARHADHRRAREGKARALRRLRRLFLGGRRNGYLHRAAHRAGEGRHHVRAGRRRHRRRQRPEASSRNTSTRPKPCFAPPKKPAVLPAPPNEAEPPPIGLTCPSIGTPNTRRKAVKHDRPDRQLRQLHLQPLSIISAGSGRTSPCIATTKFRSPTSSRMHARGDRTVTRPLHADRGRYLSRPHQQAAEHPDPRGLPRTPGDRPSVRRQGDARARRCTASCPSHVIGGRASSAESTAP